MIQRAMVVHAARSDSPERAEIRLIEGASNAPVAVGTWWYPSQRQGWEFIYPRDQALKLAKTARQPILTTAENVPAEKIDSSDLVRVEPSGSQADFSASENPQPAQVRGTAQVGEVAAADANANQVAAAMSNQSRPAASTTARAEHAHRAAAHRELGSDDRAGQRAGLRGRTGARVPPPPGVNTMHRARATECRPRANVPSTAMLTRCAPLVVAFALTLSGS